VCRAIGARPLCHERPRFTPCRARGSLCRQVHQPERRLASYRGIKSGRVSPRFVRLAFAVESITWETRAEDHQAWLCENSQRLLHQTKFNSANTHPENHRYTMLRTGVAFVELD
jgi:hypothetical protein